MNMDGKHLADTGGLQSRVDLNEYYLRAVYGHAESLLSCDTYQFSDYSLYESDIFDAEAKEKQRMEVFPQDCRAAYQMGVRFCTGGEYDRRPPPHLCPEEFLFQACRPGIRRTAE